MSVDITVSEPLSSTMQPLTDQNGNPSSLFLGVGPGTQFGAAGRVGIYGTGGPGSTTTLELSTYSPVQQTNYTANAALQVTDLGNHNGSFSINLLPPNATAITPYLTLQPSGNVQLPYLPNLPSSGTVDLVVDSQGNVTTQTSSERFKEDVRTFQDDFHKVLAIEPKAYRYKASGAEAVGYIAEDLHNVGLRDLLRYDDEGKPLAIDYKMISLYLVELVKEQQSAIAELRTEVAALKPKH